MHTIIMAPRGGERGGSRGEREERRREGERRGMGGKLTNTNDDDDTSHKITDN